MINIDIMTFIKPELLIIVVLLYIIGMVIKAAPKIPSWAIPLILTIIGIVLGVLYVCAVLDGGFTGHYIVSGVVQGILAAGLAVYGNQFYKQLFRASPADDDAESSESDTGKNIE